MLHWLPIQQRIYYRVAALVWHCLLGTAPVYTCRNYVALFQPWLAVERCVPPLVVSS